MDVHIVAVPRIEKSPLSIQCEDSMTHTSDARTIDFSTKFNIYSLSVIFRSETK